MSARMCPWCGTSNGPTASFCQRCGRPLTAGSSMPLPPPGPYVPPPSGAPVYPVNWAWSGAAPVDAATDLPAIQHMEWFAWTALAGILFGYVVNFGVAPLFGLSIFGLSNPSSGVVGGQSLINLGLVSVIGTVVTAVAFYFAREGFVHLRSHDSRFSTPATLAILAMVGLLVLTLALLVVLSSVSALLACAGTTTPPRPSCVNLGALLGGALLVLVGAILALIGFIGTAIGIWRLGSRYDDSLLRAGAVLWFFPIINLIGVILILVGLRNARNRLTAPSSTYSPTAFGPHG
ncbi:MAG TPA: DUF973 family protein [Thermoplasmata archaeon]|nr:DUF973 family protein [Thermoplasmata archaeon]